MHILHHEKCLFPWSHVCHWVNVTQQLGLNQISMLLWVIWQLVLDLRHTTLRLATKEGQVT